MACDITQLQTDACANGFSCLANLRQYDIVLLQLLCELKDAVAGGSSAVSGLYAADYGGVEPVFVPTGSVAIAFDTITGTQWDYYSNQWH